jgi:hypothetical protein
MTLCKIGVACRLLPPELPAGPRQLNNAFRAGPDPLKSQAFAREIRGRARTVASRSAMPSCAAMFAALAA